MSTQVQIDRLVRRAAKHEQILHDLRSVSDAEVAKGAWATDLVRLVREKRERQAQQAREDAERKERPVQGE